MAEQQERAAGYGAAEVVVNEGKQEYITVDGVLYRRLCLRTHVLTPQDDMAEVARHYIKPLLEEGDIVFFTEKAVAAMQGRAIPVDQIRPSLLARVLVKFVYKNPGGIGISMPESMEMAIRECGRPRILFAAFISAIGKLLGKRGWFYRIAGYRAASIDGPAEYVIAPYNNCVVLGPLEPDKVARRIAEALGCPVTVTDINDLGGQILGVSDKSLDCGLLVRILKDNPLGQTKEQTPIGIIRRTING
ncbi:MAG: coenzyme F420-0:L-glutamate ligase [Clostridiales bacterium]|nr:coenzyme F420-0:L-glutamate ligase [Clostridiales bacterium]